MAKAKGNTTISLTLDPTTLAMLDLHARQTEQTRSEAIRSHIHFAQRIHESVQHENPPTAIHVLGEGVLGAPDWLAVIRSALPENVAINDPDDIKAIHALIEGRDGKLLHHDVHVLGGILGVTHGPAGESVPCILVRDENDLPIGVQIPPHIAELIASNTGSNVVQADQAPDLLTRIRLLEEDLAESENDLAKSDAELLVIDACLDEHEIPDSRTVTTVDRVRYLGAEMQGGRLVISRLQEKLHARRHLFPRKKAVITGVL